MTLHKLRSAPTAQRVLQRTGWRLSTVQHCVHSMQRERGREGRRGGYNTVQHCVHRIHIERERVRDTHRERESGRQRETYRQTERRIEETEMRGEGMRGK